MAAELGAVERVVGDDVVAAGVELVDAQAGVAGSHHRVVRDRHVLDDLALARLGRDPAGADVHDDVVAHDDVADRLDAVVLHVPDHVAVDDVGRLVADRAVHRDARVLDVVNDVVADDGVVAAGLELDAVALRAREGVVAPVPLDHRVPHLAGVVVAAEVHALAWPAVLTGVVDVHAPDREVLVGVVGPIAGEADVVDVVDVQVLEQRVGGVADPQPVRADRDLEAAERVVAAGDVERVLVGDALDDDDLAGGRLDHDRRVLGALEVQLDEAGGLVGAGVDRDRVAGGGAAERRPEVVLGEDVDVGGEGQGQD
ncbi:MAG: hypothetical protein R3A51_00350 [Nannocystaceae bacterium]